MPLTLKPPLLPYIPAGPKPVSRDILPEDYNLLTTQNLGCLGANGVTYEVSSVLQGKPAKLQKSAKPPKPTAQPGPALDPSVLPARGQPRVEAPVAPGDRHHSQPMLPAAAIAGIVVGSVIVAALVGVIGYVVVYRRWYTVRAAQSFKKIQEGALAAAGGAVVNSSAPSAGLPHLTAPVPAADATVVLGGDDRV